MIVIDFIILNDKLNLLLLAVLPLFTNVMVCGSTYLCPSKCCDVTESEDNWVNPMWMCSIFSLSLSTSRRSFSTRWRSRSHSSCCCSMTSSCANSSSSVFVLVSDDGLAASAPVCFFFPFLPLALVLAVDVLRVTVGSAASSFGRAGFYIGGPKIR